MADHPDREDELWQLAIRTLAHALRESAIGDKVIYAALRDVARECAEICETTMRADLEIRARFNLDTKAP